MSFHRWTRYFPFHLQMAKDVEDAAEHRVRVEPEPSSRPTSGWLGRKVKKIAQSEGLILSNTASKKAAAELERAILKGVDRCRPNIHASLTKSFVRVACGWGSFLDVFLDFGLQA